MVKRGEYYPVARSDLNDKDKKKYGVTETSRNDLVAEWTGKKRSPKKGEWYLSGSKVMAYKAFNDLSPEYLIARLFSKESI